MKDNCPNLVENRPDVTAMEAVNFCLQQILNDKTKKSTDNAVTRCTYEEIIGALLLAKDHLKDFEDAGEEIDKL